MEVQPPIHWFFYTRSQQRAIDTLAWLKLVFRLIGNALFPISDCQLDKETRHAYHEIDYSSDYPTNPAPIAPRTGQILTEKARQSRCEKTGVDDYRENQGHYRYGAREATGCAEG